MKVYSESPTQLVLKEKPISQILFGGVFIAVGIYIIFIFSKIDIIGAVVGLSFMGAGILVAGFTKFSTLTINRSTNNIHIDFVGILGKKTQDITINQISEVVIQENYSHQSSGGSSLNFTLIFYLKNNQSIPLSMGSASSGLSINGIPLNIFSGRNKQVEIGQKIATFIGVPFKDNRAPTLSDITSAIGQMINQNKQENPPTNTPPVING